MRITFFDLQPDARDAPLYTERISKYSLAPDAIVE